MALYLRSLTTKFVSGGFPSCLGSHSHAVFSTYFAGLPKVKEKRLDASSAGPSPHNSNSSSDKNNLPNSDVLQHVFNKLEKDVPTIFYTSLDWKMYSPNLLLIDNIRGKTFYGLGRYFQQIIWLKFYAHFRFAYVTFEIVDMSQVPNEGRITMRWRIKGLTGLKVMLKFWQVKVWKYKETLNTAPTWHDGVSHYFVDSDGLIYKHIIDKVMEDTELADDARKRKLRLATKLAGAQAAFSTPSILLLLGAFDGLPF